MISDVILYSTLTIVMHVATPVSTRGCTPYNPFRINGTEAPNTTICPEECSCNYCEHIPKKSPFIRMVHDVRCTQKSFRRIPTNDIPVDVGILRLEQNHISLITSDNMINFHEMISLYLTGNVLQYNYINDHAFDSLSKLKTLYLDYNRALSQIRSVWFRKLLALETLYIRYSSVKTLQSGIFKNCVNLISINLSGNQIVTIPVDIFRNRLFLKNVVFSRNKINYLQDDIFLGSPEINNFFAHNNQITTMSQKVGIQNLTKLALFGFSLNPFECDCNLVWFRHWINQTNVTLVDLNQATCKNKNGTSLVSFDADSLRCYDITILMTIVTCSSVAFLTVVGTVMYIFRWDIRYWNQRRLLRKQYERLNNEGPPPIDGVQVRYDAFVSYNSKDRDWVLKSALPILEGPEFNFRLCVDFRDFIVGGAITDNISDAVKYSRKMLIVVTKNFAKSEWCYFEMEMARTRMFDDHEDIFVVVILEHVASRHMPTLLQKILRKKTYIEWTQNPDGQKVFWTRLAAALNTPNAHHDRLIN